MSKKVPGKLVFIFYTCGIQVNVGSADLKCDKGHDIVIRREKHTKRKGLTYEPLWKFTD